MPKVIRANSHGDMESDFIKRGKHSNLGRRILKHKFVYLLILPGALYFLLFKFGVMWGVLLAFQNYNPVAGVRGSDWVGLDNFINLFKDDNFYLMLRNTLAINLLSLVFMFPTPIVLALMLNEVRHEAFKKINQSIVYMPHFLSWVIVAGLTFLILSSDMGILNKIISGWGYKPISFLTEPKYFWGILVIQSIWKEVGWGTIIFLAAMAGVDPQRYEAAVVDGATRWRQIWHITLPAIQPTIVILLILKLGQMVDIGFEQVLLMMSPLVLKVAQVFDTYAYQQGILYGEFSLGVTVGLFKGVVGLALVLISNYIVRKMGHEGIY
jgi:putative aldouronate transport system permease protein